MLSRKLVLPLIGLVTTMLVTGSDASAWEQGNTKTFRVPVKVTVKPSDFSAAITSRAAKPLTTSILYAPVPFLAIGTFTEGVKDKNTETDADRYQKALLEIASFEAKLKVMQKLAGAANIDRPVDKDIKQWLEQIDKNLQVIDQRLTAVEKLLLVHDNYLRATLPKADESKKPAESAKPEPIPAPKALETRKTPVEIEPIPLPVPPFDPNRLAPR